MAKTKGKIRRVVKIPQDYLEAIDLANVIFPSLYQFENGMRIVVHDFLTACYGSNWWDASLAHKLPKVHDYAAEQQKKRDAMPWIGDSARVTILPIHLITLGQLEEIVKVYRSDCIPDLFPTIEFLLGHMEVIKRVRNLYSHMFPCITRHDCQIAKREISTLAVHLNAKL